MKLRIPILKKVAKGSSKHWPTKQFTLPRLEKVQQMLSIQLLLLVAIPACSASARKTFSLYAKEEKLYNFYQELWTEYLTDVVAPATAAPETNSEKLVELSRRYKHFMILLKTTWSKQIFLYLDRFYTPKKNLPTTLLVGYQKWREIIFQGKESGVQEAVLDLIYKDRQGEVVDRDQLQTVIRIWVDCGLKQDTSRASANNTNQATGRREITSYEMYEKVRVCNDSRRLA